MEEPIDPLRTITTTRLVRATRDKIYQAWTDPSILAKWWGPKGFTNTFHIFELRPKGLWDFTMHGPDGTDYNNVSEFAEIKPNERIVFDHVKPMHRFRASVTFSDHDGGTLITWHMIHPSVEECERMRAFVPQANEENLDRMEVEIHNFRS